MGDEGRGGSSYRDLARAGITVTVLVLVATVCGVTKFDFGATDTATAASNKDSAPTTVTHTVVVTAGVGTAAPTAAPQAASLTPTAAPLTPQSTTVTTTTTTTTTPPPPPPPTDQANQPPPLAEPVTSGRVKITVNAVSAPPTVPLLINRYQKDNPFKSSPFAQFVQTPPESGTKYVRVDTTMENVGNAPIGMTCNPAILVGVLDAQQTRFDPIPELYRLKGNPECDQELQPGQSSPMSFVFEVPKDAVIGAFGFQDVNIQTYDPTLVTF